jgi:hypothetical protein
MKTRGEGDERIFNKGKTGGEEVDRIFFRETRRR